MNKYQIVFLLCKYTRYVSQKETISNLLLEHLVNPKNAVPCRRSPSEHGKKALKKGEPSEALKFPPGRLEGGMHGVERSGMKGVSPEGGQRAGSRQRSCRGGANGWEI